MSKETLTQLDFGNAASVDASLSGLVRGLVGSEILKIAGQIRELIATGKPVCNLTVGDFDPKQFPIPASLLDGIQRALAKGETNYPPSDGMLVLRKAVADYTAREWGVRYPVESVLIAGGARPILYGAFRAALVELYGWRWHVELDLRYVKETLNIALLHAKRVDTVRKELWAGLLAYNLIRAVMLCAAQAAHCAPLTLRFTACWRRVADALLHACQSTNRNWQRLLVRLGRCRIAQQPSYRIEPRATRRRPLAYAYLKGSRQEAREEVRRSLAQGKS